jgi:hypothetical protein
MTRVVGLPRCRRLSNTISAPDGAPLRGIVEAAHPGRSRRGTPEPAPGASFWGTAGMTGWGRGLNAGALPNTISAPDCFAHPGHCGIARRLQPPPKLRGRLEVRPPEALRVGGSPPPEPSQYDRCPRWPDRPGALRVSSCPRSRLPSPAASLTRVLRGTSGMARVRNGAPPPVPPQYDLCPRWPHRPGALRVSSLRRSHLANTGARRPSGCGESCEWRGTRPIPLSPFASTCSERVIPGNTIPAPLSSAHSPSGASPRPKPAYHPRPSGYPQATDPCGAPPVSRAGHRASTIWVIRRLDPGQ